MTAPMSAHDVANLILVLLAEDEEYSPISEGVIYAAICDRCSLDTLEEAIGGLCQMGIVTRSRGHRVQIRPEWKTKIRTALETMRAVGSDRAPDQRGPVSSRRSVADGS